MQGLALNDIITDLHTDDELKENKTQLSILEHLQQMIKVVEIWSVSYIKLKWFMWCHDFMLRVWLVYILLFYCYIKCKYSYANSMFMREDKLNTWRTLQPKFKF